MKKIKMFKLLEIMVLTMIILPCVPVNAYSSNNTAGSDTLKEAFINEFGNDYLQYLEDNSYELSIAQKIDDLIKKNYVDSYPDYYGGMYISDDSKNLIIQIVERNIPKNDTSDYYIYKKLISMDNTIMIEYVRNSFKNLNDVHHMISNNYKYDKNFSSMYIDVVNNNVVIELLDNSLLKQEDFKNYLSVINKMSLSEIDNLFDSNLITFMQGSIKEHTSSLYDMYPGQSIAVPGGTCSMGFRTKYNGHAGYMTAGHCVMIDGTNTILATGQVKVFQYQNQQVGDYAFVQTSTYTPLNTMKYGMNNLAAYPMDLLVTTAPTLVVGTAIAKEGATTHYTAGTITALNYDVYYNSTGKTIKGLVKATLSSAQGDSGGVVFIPQTNFTAKPIGIISGGNTGLGEAYFTSIHSLPYALKSGRY